MKPVYIMHGAGVTDAEFESVRHGVAELLRIGNVLDTSVHSFGLWRNEKWLNGQTLQNWQSVDWYLAWARKKSSRADQLNADYLLTLLFNEPWQKSAPHSDVLAVAEDLYCENTNFVIGAALPDVATVISVARFRSLDVRLKHECIKTETMHEVGHVFGLVPTERTTAVEESLGKHCTNICVMRQGLRVPDDWIRISRDRLAHGALCELCRRDLRQYFK